MTVPRTGPVLDASALVALVFEETGSDVIEKILDSGNAIATPLALAETLRTCRRKGLAMESDAILQYFVSRNLRIEPVLDEDITAIAANIALCDDYRATNKKAGALSIADATCIAVAQRLGSPVVVSDGYWDNLDFGEVEIVQFR